jgi:hypothetical protein
MVFRIDGTIECMLMLCKDGGVGGTVGTVQAGSVDRLWDLILEQRKFGYYP